MLEDHCTVRCDVLCDTTHPERVTEAERLCTALRRNGHAFLDGGVATLPLEMLRRTFDVCRRAHALPRAERERFAGGLERTRLTYSAAEEAYEVGTEASAESWNFSRSREWSAGPQKGASPKGLEQLDSFADDLYSRQDHLALGLLAAVSESLGLPPQTFGQHLRQGDLGTIRLMRYPPRPPNDKSCKSRGVGISAHTDFELITLMAQDAPGLQLMFPPAGGSTLAGEWVELPVHDGQYIVIVNDMLERFTNGVLVATPHRVRASSTLRHSIIRFVAVHPDTEVYPLHPFVTAQRPAAYSRVTMGEHMQVTMKIVREGGGAWDQERGRSLSATRQYGTARL